MTHDLLRPLEPLVGTWDIAMSGRHGEARGSTTFAWTLDGAFLTQTSTSDLPGMPDALSVIAPDGDGAFCQHYFDSRGVVRLYGMTFAGGVWTLERTQPDFSRKSFDQRFRGTVSGDAATIEGRWEIREGSDWEVDFDLRYTRSA